MLLLPLYPCRLGIPLPHALSITCLVYFCLPCILRTNYPVLPADFMTIVSNSLGYHETESNQAFTLYCWPIGPNGCMPNGSG